MTYQTLYRKYRSASFTELVGQEHVIKTLQNAIEYDRLSHAYIFSGPRGTGKTSMARILAKMVNKTTDSVDDCPICQKITIGSCIDVIEIDAASHTGVDHMRQLTEQVQFLPVEAMYKVFIIDEVHMLSTGAFNALLKTLEEPPKNVLFLLATTELHKIPATIQSRAQTLHFRLIESALMADHIQSICQKESVTIQDQALTMLISAAKGGMRDALSLLDQLISICQNQTIVPTDIEQLLGTVDRTQLHQFLAHCFQGSAEAVAWMRKSINEGVHIFQLYDDILNYLNDTFLATGKNNFSVDDKVVSGWLIWFCEQLASLKPLPYPDIVAQVALNKRIQELSQPTVTEPAPAVPAQQAVKTQPPPTPPASQGVASAPVPPPIKQQIDSVQKPEPEPESNPAPDSNPSKSVVSATPEVQTGDADLDKIWESLYSKVHAEFKLLAPVLKGASILTKGSTLCLLIESSYQFFEKKLSEARFKDWLLPQFTALTGQVVTELFVTSDINTIHQLDGDTKTTQETGSVVSKTVNQIIEMFDGHLKT
jgi:DNA polymerase III subunit gamma/tau